MPGEVEAWGVAPEVAAIAWIVTRQLAPGIRVRTAFTPPSPPPDDETLGQTLFDLLAEYGGEGFSQIPMAKIRERWSQIAPPGRA